MCYTIPVVYGNTFRSGELIWLNGVNKRMATVVKDGREHAVTLARFLLDDGGTPNPPDPAWCLIVDGRSIANFRVGEERALIEAYFRAGKDGAKAA